MMDKKSTPETQQVHSANEKFRGSAAGQNEWACKTILNILKHALPILFIVGGFSSIGKVSINFSIFKIPK